MAVVGAGHLEGIQRWMAAGEPQYRCCSYVAVVVTLGFILGLLLHLLLRYVDIVCHV